MRAACQRGLALLIPVEHRFGRLILPLALIHLAEHLPVEHGVGRGDHQLPGVPPHGVTRLDTRARGNQRVVKIAGLTPAFTAVLETVVQPGVKQIARRTGHFIQLAVRTAQPALANLAALHIQGAAGQIDQRALFGDHIVAGKTHRPTLRHPFADAVRLGAEITADFKQAAGGVPAIRGIAVGARRHVDQFAYIDPDVIAVERALLAVDRGIALLVALHIDLDVVVFHRHLDAECARHVDHRPVAHQAAALRRHCHLPAGSEGNRAVLELDAATALNLDTRLIAPNPVVRSDRAEGRLMLTVERGQVAAVEHDRRDTALRQRDAAVGVAGGVGQVNGAASSH